MSQQYQVTRQYTVLPVQFLLTPIGIYILSTTVLAISQELPFEPHVQDTRSHHDEQAQPVQAYLVVSLNIYHTLALELAAKYLRRSSTCLLRGFIILKKLKLSPIQ